MQRYGDSVRRSVGLVGLVLLSACSAAPGRSGASETNVAAPSVTPSPNVSPAPVLDDRFGFILSDSSVGPRPVVRRESDARPVFTMREALGAPMAVSPDGRRLAYWTRNELHIMDVAENAQPNILLAVTTVRSVEEAHGLAWSSDSTGLVIGVTGPPINEGADAPPAYSALRIVEASGGEPREIVRIEHRLLVPLSWDRRARAITAYEQAQSGATSLDVIDEGGKLERNAFEPGPVSLQSSQDGHQVLAAGYPDNVLWVWSPTAAARPIELRSAAAERILAASWRPGTSDIGVLVGDRLELWNSSGSRRPVPLPSLPATSNLNRSLIFRADGSGVFVGLVLDPRAGERPDVYLVAVDLASGRSAVVVTNGIPPLASVRISP
jgi:WD40 repeat protein